MTEQHILMLKGAISDNEDKLRKLAADFDAYENTITTNLYASPRSKKNITQITNAANKLGALFTDCETILARINDSRAKLGLEPPKTLEDYGI